MYGLRQHYFAEHVTEADKVSFVLFHKLEMFSLCCQNVFTAHRYGSVTTAKPVLPTRLC